ncbi:MAG: hypothetical protein E7353_00180 [Clostridiales bacterium]|nr:hypothetical protein [Clostridiales bacterium]
MKTSVPMNYNIITQQNKYTVLDYLKKGEIDRVFLVFMANEKLYAEEKEFEILKENSDFLTSNNIETTCWTNAYIGHGGVLSHDVKQTFNFTEITSIKGETISGNYCPLDPDFVKTTCKLYKRIAQTGVKTLVLDDDFRMSQRDGKINCCCKYHLNLMSDIAGETITREHIEKYAFTGKPNKYRNAWIKAQGEGLKRYAQAIRRAIDEVNPKTRVAFCSAGSPWYLDGADVLGISRLMAGEGNKPILRLLGAPYTYHYGECRSFSKVIDQERMFYSFCKDANDIEFLSEGDTYPRPRYRCPATWTEIFDAILRADGKYDCILKYISDYSTPFEYETGYFNSHIKALPMLKKVEEFFKGGEIEGVRVYSYPHNLKDTEVLENYTPEVYMNALPYAHGDFLSGNNVPTTYDNDGITAFIAGEHARHVDLSAIKNGAILDGNGAKILTERGVDVGINKILKCDYVSFNSENYQQGKLLYTGNFRILQANFNKNIEILSYVNHDGKDVITAYRYTNNEGKKFLVFTFFTEELLAKSVLKANYYREEQIINGVEWISDKKLPAKIRKNPDTYLLCKRTINSLKVGVFNCYPDEIINPEIILDKEYSEIKFLNSSGKIVNDKVVLDNDIPPFKYVCFEVFD